MPPRLDLFQYRYQRGMALINVQLKARAAQLGAARLLSSVAIEPLACLDQRVLPGTLGTAVLLSLSEQQSRTAVSAVRNYPASSVR
jgi:hypothetical protein